jgi:hypothetical protein
VGEFDDAIVILKSVLCYKKYLHKKMIINVYLKIVKIFCVLSL